jgi:hypothetical protein
MMRVLLTGARAPVTLDLARHFAWMGHEVFLADSISLPLARLSSVIKKSFVVSKPVDGVASYVNDLCRITDEHKIDLLIPTCEEIYYIGSRLGEFANSVRIFAAPLSVLEPLHNKWSFVNLVANLGEQVQAPETCLLSDRDDVIRWQKDRTYEEWVLKPVYSRFAARTLIGPTANELETLEPNAADRWVAQQRIRGQEYSTYSVAIQGRLTAHVCYRSLYRAGPGSGIYFIAVKHQPVHQFVEQFVAQQHFTGQIGFDFIEDAHGQAFVLECNPRATSGLHLLHGQPLADAFSVETTSLLEPPQDIPAMLASIMMLYAFPQAIVRWELRSLFKAMREARDVIYDRKDPWPAICSPLSLVEVIITAFRTRKPLTHAATYDIEWNGESLKEADSEIRA